MLWLVSNTKMANLQSSKILPCCNFAALLSPTVAQFK
jgi:hypothetical protein